MCLTVQTYSRIGDNYKIAKRNITCFKVLKINDWGEKETPVYNAKVPAWCFECQTPFEAKGGEWVYTDVVSEINHINEGFIHTFIHSTDAVNYMEQLKGLKPNERFYLYKCIVPKGTKYFEGKDGAGRKSYASRRIIFKKEVNPKFYGIFAV